MIDRLTAALSDRYRIERELGAGGMATVYLAEDVRHERKVALKVLRPELAAVIGAERFLAEIKTTANLQHPHILPLFDSGESDGFLWYVMPYIEGETLRERVEREGQLGVEESVRIAVEVADALDYAHRNGIIHRDIKPANILLHDGRPVVADFGIALAISAAGGGRMTETGLSLGTPHYMSPEQASADRDLTARSDVYSLGCVLYEMLAGQPPHTGPSAQSILVRILTEDPRPLIEERRSVPPHVAAAVAKAIEKLPADRFSTAADFGAALQDRDFTWAAPFRAGRAVGSVPRPASGARSPSAAGRLLPWGVAAVALLVAITAVAWSGDDPPGTPTVLELDVGDQRLFSFTWLEVAPDASAFGLRTASGDLWVRRAEEAEFREVISGSVGDFDFSPNAEWIVMSDTDGQIRRVSVDGGPATTLTETDGGWPAVTWSDDGHILLTLSGGEATPGLYRMPEVGGAPELLLARSGLVDVSVLPDGRGYLLTDGPAGSVLIYEPGSSRVREVLADGVGARYLESGHLAFGHPDGGLHVIPFDLDRREVTGAPVPMRDDLLVANSRAFFSVARDGTLLYLSSPAGPPELTDAELLAISLESPDDDRALPLSPRPISDLRLAPDGRQLAFLTQSSADSGSRELWLYDLAIQDSPRPLGPISWVAGVAWDPAGARLAYEAEEERGDIVIQAPSGRADTLHAPIPEASRIYVRDWFTPDSILVGGHTFGPNQNHSLWIVPVDGGEPRNYLTSERPIGDARISPAGDRIAYAVGDGRVGEIVVRPFPDVGEPFSVATHSLGPIILDALAWDPAGSSLFYTVLVRSTPRIDSLFVVNVRNDPSVAIEPPKLLRVEDPPVRGFELLPDGQSYLGFRDLPQPEATERRENRALVVLNWLEDVRARLGGR